MAERHSSWRLCHDMSWPPDDPVIQSPNDADFFVMVVVFCSLDHLAFVAAIFSAAGVEYKFIKFDLTKAYKRTGQQRAERWRRTTWSDKRSQSLDRVCFGQRDGPEVFSRQSTMMVFIMRRELAFMCDCYPPRDPSVIAFVRLRMHLAAQAGAADVRAWSALAFVMAMIDDFGAAIVDDLLFRCDGSPVLDSSGEQRRRASMGLEVCLSVVYRIGHSVQQDDPLKFALPCDRMLLLGSYLDREDEVISFDDDRRDRNREALSLALVAGSFRPRP